MNRVLIVVVLLFAVFGSHCHQAPAVARQYDLGTTYKYNYLTTVLMNEAPPLQTSQASPKGKDVGYQITASVDMTAVWQNPSDSSEKLLQLKVTKPKLLIMSRKAPTPEGFIEHSSKLDSFSNSPIYLQWNNGKVVKVFAIQSEPLSLLNFKKGIASIFQYQSSTSQDSEVDASGRCTVSYRARDNRNILKQKKDCSVVRPATFFTHTNKVLGADVDSSIETLYTLARDQPIIERAKSIEIHSFRVTARKETGATVVSKQVLKLKGHSGSGLKLKASLVEDAVRSLSKKLKKELIVEELAMDKEERPCGENCRNLPQFIKEMKESLRSKNLATIPSASAFRRLVHRMRNAAKDDILGVLKDKANKEIIPQLLDAVAAAQTIPAHQAAMSILSFKSGSSIEYPERYLLAVSLSTHPSEHLIRDLFELRKSEISNEKLYETLILTIAALTRTFCNIPNNGHKQVVQDVKNAILEKLTSCKDIPCREMYLRALKNLVDPGTIPTLLKYIQKDRKTSVQAIKALQAMPAKYIDDHVRVQLEKVYHQIGKKYDSSARAIAVDILLQTRPPKQTLKDIFLSLESQDYPEINTYVLQRIEENMEKDCYLKSLMKELAKNTKIFNYNTLAQNGISTAFTRILTANENGNSTFSSGLEISGGVLKRNSFDIFMQNSEHSLHLFSLGIFAGGLASFAGGVVDPEEAEEDATAGLELALMGVQLRPIVFFTSTGELMGLLWSGTGSERTTALQGTILLQDHSQVVPLQNGFTSELSLTGVVSYDLAGQVQVSLWNRNSHSLVENSAALVMHGLLSIDTSFIRSEVEFDVAFAATLNFVSDSDFSGDILLCLQLSQPEFIQKQRIFKTERIPSSKHRLRKSKRKAVPVPGKTYVFNQKNSYMCDIMFK